MPEGFEYDRVIEHAGRTLSVTGFDGDGHVKITVEGRKTYDLDFNAASGTDRPPSAGPSALDVEHVPAGTNGKCVIDDGPLTITAERSLFDEAVVILTVDGGTDKPTTHTLDFAEEAAGSKVSATRVGMGKPARPRPMRRAESPSPPASGSVAAESSLDWEPVASDGPSDSSVAAAERDATPSPATSSTSSTVASDSVDAESDVVPSAAAESDVSSGLSAAESEGCSGPSMAEPDVDSGSTPAESAPSPAAESLEASGSVVAESEPAPGSGPAEEASPAAIDSDMATSSAPDAPSRSATSSPAIGDPAGTNPLGDPSGTLSGVLVPEQPADTSDALSMMAGAGVAAGGGIGWSVHGDLFDSGDPVYSVHGVLGEDDLTS